MALLVFEHSERTGIMRLGETLRNYGHRLRIVRLHADDPFPADLDDVDGIVSCGGPQSAYDDSIDWLEPEMDIMRQAHEAQMPIVGICLGCQILARALGGTVERMEAGPEIGWREIRLTPTGREDPIHVGLAWSPIVAHWHGDHVSELPPDARLLASSDHCKVQAWASGVRTYGFQYHPEIRRDTFDHFIAEHPETLTKAGVTVEELRTQTTEHFEVFERLTQRLFESMALFLMPIDRRYYGLAKDVLH